MAHVEKGFILHISSPTISAPSFLVEWVSIYNSIGFLITEDDKLNLDDFVTKKTFCEFIVKDTVQQISDLPCHALFVNNEIKLEINNYNKIINNIEKKDIYIKIEGLIEFDGSEQEYIFCSLNDPKFMFSHEIEEEILFEEDGILKLNELNKSELFIKLKNFSLKNNIILKFRFLLDELNGDIFHKHNILQNKNHKFNLKLKNLNTEENTKKELIFENYKNILKYINEKEKVAVVFHLDGSNSPIEDVNNIERYQNHLIVDAIYSNSNFDDTCDSITQEEIFQDSIRQEAIDYSENDCEDERLSEESYENECLLNDLDSDLDDYNRSDENGWYYDE